MSFLGEALGVIALVPAMVGPVGGGDRESMVETVVMALCGGGVLAVEIGGNQAPGPAVVPCCAKGCHSRDQRRKRQSGKLDLEQ